MTVRDWYSINDIDKLDTPALVVYPDRVKQNIAMAISMIDDAARLRPHVKTFKNREIVGLMMQKGIMKFKCATIAEAEMLALCGAPDVLLAYQPVGPKLERFMELILAYPGTHFTCLVDNITSAEAISQAAVQYGDILIEAYVDLNVGMNRTGIHPDEVLQLYHECQKLPHLVIKGLHTYDGQIHDVDMAARTAKCNAGFEPVYELLKDLWEPGYPDPVVIAGGSPTYPIHAKRKPFTDRAPFECSPGTFVYWDRGYQLSCPEQAFLPAALVVTRVVSLPGDNLVCLDAGHKSIASENTLDKRIYFLNAPELKPVSHSEEHIVVDAGAGHNYKIGDVLYGLPYHICPTVALYERAIIIEDNTISGEWLNIARDRKINI